MKCFKKISSILLSALIIFSMMCGCSSKAEQEQRVQDVLTDVRVVVDGNVHIVDIAVMDGTWCLSAQDARTIFGGDFSEDYVDLDAYAKAEDIRYIQDEVLTAAYINTWKPYEVHKWDVEFNIYDDGTDFERAFYMGLVDESLRDRADEQITSTEFRAILAKLIRNFAPETIEKFDANVTDVDIPLSRDNGIIMAYYAAVCLGFDSYNVGANVKIADDWDNAAIDLFPNVRNQPGVFRWEGSDTDEYWYSEYDAALFWSVGRKSTVSNTLMFTVNPETGDLDIFAPMTVRDAVSVLVRLYDGVGEFEEVDDKLLATPSSILSDAHFAKATSASEVTAENHPQWTGFVLNWCDGSEETLTIDNIYYAANWGFNSIRMNINYRYLFDTDGETYLCNLANLQKLDSYIAAAIECGMHIDICLTDQPGREAYDKDFSDWGDFDLFINPEKQEKAFWIWEIFAERYKGIPNSYLSFSPLWEVLNSDLSTGLGAPEYSPGDVGAYFVKLIDVIHAKDEDRLITYELCGEDPSLDEPILNAIKGKTNILANYNFVDQPFVYFSMHVPEDGGNGDNNNHSYPVQEYPTYLYSVHRFIKEDDPIRIDGCLPAGTTINLHLKESFGSMLQITADVEVLHSEYLSESIYPTSYRRSLYSLYAQSEKCISVILEKDTDELVLSASGEGVEWSGMDVILPDEYARDYWYFNSPYDVYIGLVDAAGMAVRQDALITIAPTQDGLGVGAPRDDEAGRTITIHKDTTYTTDVLWRETSADTIEGYISSYVPVGGDPIVRFEAAYFAGVAWEDVAEYYSDMFDVMEQKNISWWSNDFAAITRQLMPIGGAEYVQYDEYESFNLELLKLLQQYQNIDRQDGTSDNIQVTEELSTTVVLHSEEYEIIHGILNDTKFYYLDEAEALAPYYEKAAQRKESILYSPTGIVKGDEFIPGQTYTGTAYYVSPNGNDENDGLSPETAWQNIYMVNGADLHEGDAVFFERGGVYRLLGDRLNLADGVTYSAYGEGAKPVITLSQENSARTECWELYYEGESGEKIWKFYQDLGEVGGVIFDDETYAARVYELPTDEGWMALDILTFDPANGIYDENDPCSFWKPVTTGRYPTIEEALTEDMTFVTRVDLTDVSFPSGFAEWRVYGGLYLRCDSGNPGTLFSSINIISRREGYGMDGILLDGTMAKGYVLDNLSLKYCTGPIAGSFTESGREVIQNCTFEWGGPVLLDVQTPDNFDGGYFVASDGLYNVANNTTIRNNYFRQVGNGPTFESSEFVPDNMGTYTVEGNLIENCAQGIRTYLLEEEGAFDSIILRDNIIINSGDSMNNGCFEEPVAIDLGAINYQFYKEIEISENILIGSTAAMLRLSYPERFQYNFHDNVIVQDRDGLILTVCNNEVEWYWMKDAKE